MANSVGGIIEDVDYNSIRNKIIAVLGTGSGNTGYGQAARLQSSAVADGNTVNSTQWGNLRFDIYNCLVHQNGTTPSIVSVNTGDTIRYGAGHPNNAYDTLANTITSNRFNLGSGQFVTESLASANSGDVTWLSQIYVDITYTFSTAETARFFFNSGGQLRVTSSFVKSVTKDQTTSWENLVSSAGQQGFGGQVPSTGFSPLNGSNFFRLTNTFQTYYTATSSGPYSSNTYNLQARSNVADNSSGTANIVYIRVLLNDPYTDPPLGIPPASTASVPPEDSVSGTLSVSTDMIRASGVMQPAPATGNFVTSGPNPAGGGTTSIGSFIYS
jgi:hypothetical protein